MAMKCSALLLLLIQAGRLSSCVFDKVEELSGIGADFDYKILNKNECFAECYNNKSCVALVYHEYDSSKGLCALFGSGSVTYECAKDKTCHILQRDEVDLTCQTYLNI